MKSNKIVTTIILLGVLTGVIFTCTPKAEVATGMISVLHTNDIHSQVLPVAKDKGRWGDYGGFSRIAHVVDSVRASRGEVLLLSCGDFCQGTPFFNFFGGKTEVDFMNKLGYTATTLGNHEFDNGMESLANVIRMSNFPYVVSNYDFSQTPLSGLVEPYHMINYKGVKVGLIGLTVDISTLVSKENSEGAVYLDPVKSAQQWTDTLLSRAADVVICMSHLGDREYMGRVGDVELAAATSGIDVILGGHSHVDMIKVVKNNKGEDVTITQVASQGRLLGEVNIFMGSKEE